MQEGPENTTPLGTPPEGTPEPPVESAPEPVVESIPEVQPESVPEVAPEPESVPLMDIEVLEAALAEAQTNNNQFDRTEAKVDALAKYILSQK